MSCAYHRLVLGYADPQCRRCRNLVGFSAVLQNGWTDFKPDPVPHYAADGTQRHPGEECVPGVCWTDERTEP